STRRFCRKDPQGDEARRSAGRAAGEIRIRGQSQDCKGDRRRVANIDSPSRRRGDRIIAAAHESGWHIATFRCDAEFGRYRGVADSRSKRTDQVRFMSTRPSSLVDRVIRGTLALRWLAMTAYASGGRVDLPQDVQATADCHFVVQFALQRIRPGFTAQARDRIVTRIAKAAG